MPAQTTVLMPRLVRISRRLVPVSAESVVLVTTISSPWGASSGTICEACSFFGRRRLFQPGIFWLNERSRPSLRVAGDAREQAFDAGLAEGAEEVAGARDDLAGHALVEGRPGIVAALLRRESLSRSGRSR